MFLEIPKGFIETPIEFPKVSRRNSLDSYRDSYRISERFLQKSLAREAWERTSSKSETWDERACKHCKQSKHRESQPTILSSSLLSSPLLSSFLLFSSLLSSLLANEPSSERSHRTRASRPRSAVWGGSNKSQARSPRDSYSFPRDSHRAPTDSNRIPTDSHRIPRDSKRIFTDSYRVLKHFLEIPAEFPKDSRGISVRYLSNAKRFL